MAKVLAVGIVGIALIIGLVLLQIWATYELWNWVVVAQGAKPVGMMEAAGLLFLVRIMIPTASNTFNKKS